LAALLAHSGDSWFRLLGLVVLYWLGPETWHRLLAIFFFGIILTAAVVFAIKFTVRRRRPEGEWGNIYRNTDPHSFPSGHAARAGMLAILAIGSGPLWLGLLLAVWAPIVGLARVAMGVHYLSDVVAGLVLGVIIGLVLGIFF
jgi:undecaprenyl-diphosphatase